MDHYEGSAPAAIATLEPRPPSPRALTAAVSGMASAILLAVLVILPSPYTIEQPGPTFDVFDGGDAATLVTVRGTSTYDPSGELRLTTVKVSRASTARFTLGPVIRAWLSPDASTYPEYSVPGNFEEAVRQQWISSQEMATVAALDQLGIEVPASIRLAAIDDTSHATGLLEVDDEIIDVDGTSIGTLQDLSRALDALRPGDDVTVTVLRGQSQVTATFATIGDETSGALMGVYVDPTFDMPFQVEVAIDNVGGPSAGLIFTLAIIDLLTPEDELHGARVAGTGTIGPEGEVGPIGGIALKMKGARHDGADWFLAPESNCDAVVGNIPDGLRVVSVGTLDDAYRAVVAIGEGRADGLPTCA